MQTQITAAARAPRARRVRREPATKTAPHSWDVKTWPPQVWPHKAPQARWVLRSYRNELLYHRALTRIGKRLVVLGDGWLRFLTSQAKHVQGYESNSPECNGNSAAKRDASVPA